MLTDKIRFPAPRLRFFGFSKDIHRAKAMAVGILFSAVVLQTCHEIEHLAQFYQRWWLGVGPQEARGILFFLDVEWNHFLFNVFYFPLLGGAAAILLFHSQFSLMRQGRIGRIGLASLLFGLFVQGYHVLEHTVRMGQYFQLGCTPCPGILGKVFDLVYLHFVLNTSTWLLPMGALPALWKARARPLEDINRDRQK